MRRIVAILAVLPAAAIAQTPADPATPPSVLVSTQAPHQGSLPHTLTAYGTVQAAPGGSQALSLLRSGQVMRVLVALGQRVRQGDPLLALRADPATLAAYRQAVAALTLARGERDRMAQMLAQHLATRDLLAQADNAVIGAQSNLDALDRAGGGSAEQTLTAPFDGVVSALSAAPGARVAAQAPLVTVDRSSQLIAAIGVEPAQRRLVAAGQPAEVQPLDGGATLVASVLSVGAMLDPATRLVPVLVDPPEPVGPADPLAGLLPGGAVRVVVHVGDYRGWIVPRDAVLMDAQGAYVFQVEAGHAVRVAVQALGTVGGLTAVTGPVDPARPLVTAGNYQLQGGEAVRTAPADAKP